MKKIFVMLFMIGFVFTGFTQGKRTQEIHVVKPGQTVFFVSKMYNMSVDDLLKHNPDIGKDYIISPGQTLIVLAETNRKELAPTKFKYHIVQKGETLYKLSNMYPDVSVDDIIYLNKLEGSNIKIGDTLIVQKVKEDALYTKTKTSTKVTTPVAVKEDVVVSKESTTNTGITFNTGTNANTNKENASVTVIKEEPVVTTTTTTTTENVAVFANDDNSLYKELFDTYPSQGYTLKKDKGIADFVEQGTSGSYLAMADDAEPGSIIRVRNLMNNRVVYLKVVDRLPQADKTRNISLVVSKEAATDLKVIEDRFLSEWSYYVR